MTEPARFSIRQVDEASAPDVCQLYRTIYGDDFPLPDVYDPALILEANRSGRQVNLVALDGDTLAGQAVAVRSPWNSRLYEMVGLMVLPEARSSGVGRMLARELLGNVFPRLDWSARYTESTTAHVNSQKVDLRMGHVHSALALEILPPDAFGHDEIFETAGRVSCVMSFFENPADPGSGPCFLAKRYAAPLQELAGDFSPREFKEDGGALEGKSSLQVIPFEKAGTAYLPVEHPGADLAFRLDEVLAGLDGMSVTLLELPLTEGVSAALELAREGGFFFGGFLPRWFENADGLLLQRTAEEPHWDGIHVLPGHGEDLVRMIRADREARS